MEVLIFVILFGVITGMIAHSKGYSFLGWFVYGALLFIVAIVHILLKPSLPGSQSYKNQHRDIPHKVEIVGNDNSIGKLKELHELFKSGAISEDEFNRLKQKIIT